jgi:hypothetical protein
MTCHTVQQIHANEKRERDSMLPVSFSTTAVCNIMKNIIALNHDEQNNSSEYCLSQRGLNVMIFRQEPIG